jgi:hypothetical protein
MQEINEVGNVHDRIVQMVDHFCKGNKAAFGRATNIQSGVLAGLIGGRKNKPSFEVMQKIMTGYPSINPIWLLFGRGSMTQEEFPAEAPAATVKYLTVEESRRQIAQLKQEMQEDAASLIGALKDSEKLLQVYRIGGAHTGGRKLADRLGMTEEEARELVLNGQIRSTYIGKDNERAHQNGVSYFISEEAVREFLGDKSPT